MGYPKDMKITLLVAAALSIAQQSLALGTQTPAPQAPASLAQAAGKILHRDNLLLLGAIEDWRAFLEKAPEAKRGRHLPELLKIKASAEQAKTVEGFRPVEVRFEGWKKTVVSDLYPAAVAYMPQHGSVDFSEAQVLAFQAMEQAKKSGKVKAQDLRLFNGLKSQISAASDGQSLDKIFDNFQRSHPSSFAALAKMPVAAAYAGPAPTGAVFYTGAARKLSPDRVAPPPSPVSLGDLSSTGNLSNAQLTEYAVKNWGFPRPIVETVIRQAAKFGVDPRLPLAMMRQESGGRSGVVSSAGASGLMQLMPATAESLGVPKDKIFDTNWNIWGGIKYIRELATSLKRKGYDSLTYIVAAYNAGPGRITKYNGVPPFAETRDYVKKVMKNLSELVYKASPAPGVQVASLN